MAKRNNNKMQISVYRISEGQKYDYENWNDVIDRIMESADAYKIQTLKHPQYHNYHARVYACNEPAYDPKKIINFYKPIIEDNQSLLCAKNKIYQQLCLYTTTITLLR